MESSENKQFHQPKAVKDLKFISHGLTALNNFILELPAYLSALERLTADSSHTDTAVSYLHKLTDSRFKINLAFLRDLLSLVSVFSKEFQRDNTCLNDYYNNVDLLKHCLQDIDLNNCSQQMPNYDFQKNHDSVGLTIPPVRNLRSYSKQTDSSPLETMSREHKSIITGLVHSLTKQFRERPKQSELISEGALVLNDFVDEI